MSATTTLETLITFSKSLESGSNSNDITYVIDILKAIKDLEVSKEVIQKATKVGSQISSLRKKFQSQSSTQSSELLSLCKEILTKWKLTLGSESSSTSTHTNNNTLQSPSAQLKLRLKPAATTASAASSSSSGFDPAHLSESRKRVRKILLSFIHSLDSINLSFFCRSILYYTMTHDDRISFYFIIIFEIDI